MAKLDSLAGYLDKLLAVGSVPDYPDALNGLQLRNRSGTVTKVAAAVDASLPVVAAALAERADLLVVHHGLFWGGARRIDGAYFEKLASAIAGGLAVYSVHLPLDVHRRFGNNALLAKSCGLVRGIPFLPWKGLELGLKFAVDTRLRALVDRVEAAVGGPVHLCAAGPARVRTVGLVTGGAGSEVAAAAEAGVDTFITGEGPHHSYTAAEELGINVLYAGHYATETFGVRALADHLASRYKIGATFIDHPTGM
jgi:dinuclear metal center YbgI/SA1388 family protein